MQTTTNITQNKLIARTFLALVSKGNLKEICSLIDPNWKMHIGLSDFGIPAGPEGMRKLFESFGNIEQEWIINDVIAEGDKVVRATNNCTQDNFLGVPSCGRPQTFTATFIHRIVDGKIVETYRNADDLGRLLQLGAQIVPASAN